MIHKVTEENADRDMWGVRDEAAERIEFIRRAAIALAQGIVTSGAPMQGEPSEHADLTVNGAIMLWDALQRAGC